MDPSIYHGRWLVLLLHVGGASGVVLRPDTVKGPREVGEREEEIGGRGPSVRRAFHRSQ